MTEATQETVATKRMTTTMRIDLNHKAILSKLVGDYKATIESGENIDPISKGLILDSVTDLQGRIDATHIKH